MSFRPTLPMLALLGLVAAAAGPALAQPKPATQPASMADPVVARVNGTEIHRSDVIDAQRYLPPQAQQMPPEQLYPQLLDQMVSRTLLAQAGRKLKLEADAEVKRRTQQAIDNVIEEAYLARIVDDATTEDKLKARYDSWSKTQAPREQVHARHILLAKKEEAQAVIADLKKGMDFAELAKQRSTDPAGKAGGDLGYFTKEEMVPEFADAAFKLKPGEISQEPVQTKFGWHVIQVQERRAAPAPKYEEAREKIADDIAREIVSAKVKELRSAGKIETYAIDGSRLAPLPGK